MDIEYKTKNAWTKLNKKEVMDFSEQYRQFLTACKTERETVEFVQEQAVKRGYVDLFSDEYKGGDFLAVNDNKNILLFKKGKAPIEKGINFVVAHIDSPRIDVKQNPLYEGADIAMFKTHYYGGIKKYQWVTVPLALHGVIILKNGEKLSVSIGESADDPVFMISDLLPHLAKKQMEKPVKEVIVGEALDPVVGSIPVEDEKEKNRIKKYILNLLHDKYGIVEEDFISSELTFVPAGSARDVGFDNSILMGYGHDDKVCAYTAYCGLFDSSNLDKSAMVLLMDKEETGSDGITGSQSDFFEYVIEKYIKMKGIKDLSARDVFHRSFSLSADVNAAIDPLYKDVFEEQNAAMFGHGIVMTKYTGSGGKYSSSDASAELVYLVRSLFNQCDIPWQIGELGKVDIGGGGTIAKFMAKRGIATVDAGPALLSMHAPFELASKADIYSSYLAYKAFLEKFTSKK